mgnify:CR=1 FL=1
MRLRFGHLALLHDTEGGHAAPDADTKDTQASDTANAHSQGHGTEGEADTSKTYTEEEVKARLRGQGKEIERLKAAEAELASLRAKEEERRQAEMTEIERVKAQAASALEAKTAAEAARDEAIAKARKDRAEMEARSEVAAFSPVDPSVLALIPAAATATDEDGNRTAEAKKALEDWIKGKTGSLLKGKGGATGPASTGSRNAQGEKKYRNPANAALIAWRDANRNA